MSEVASTHKDDVEDDTNQPTCTVCYYPLNHELYEIKRIPGLGVASCVVCFEKLKRAKAFKVRKATETRMQALLAPPGNEDTCSWCRRDDQGTLLLCGNENTCPHQFCETCVVNNLGEAELAKFTADDDWCCFVCDPTPLASLQQQCERLQSESCYSALVEVESDEEMEARVMFHILEQIVKEINEKSIECDRIIEKCDEDFGDENVRMPIRLAEKERLRDLWAHHFLVLETQESLLCDALKDLGYSGEVALLHKSIIDEQETSLVYNQEKFSRFQANDSLNQVPWREDTRTIRKPQSEDMLYFDESDSDPSDNDEASTELAQLTSLAEQDAVVMQYADEPDINPAEFPKEFSRKVPLLVLKALCHVGNDEREELIEKYGIPRHIAIVMAYADLTFPARINDWSIRNKLHPKVLQALYYAITPPEVAILGNRYHLSSDLTGVIDFDDEDDDFSSADDAPKPRINKLNEDVKDPKRRRRELPAQQRREAYEMESKADRTYVQRVRKSAMKDFKQKKSKLARGILTSLKRLRSCPRQPRVSSAKNGTSLVERTPAITDDSSDSDELEQESHSSDSASDGSDDEVTRKTVEKETISDSSDSDDDEGEEVVDSVFSSFPSVRKFAHKYLRKKSKVQRSRPTSVRRSSRSSTTASERTTTTKSQRSDDHEEKGGDAKIVNKAQAKEPKKGTCTASCFQDYIDLTLEDDDDSFLDEVETRTKGSGSKQTSARHFFKPNGKSASIKLSEESLTAREIEIKRQAVINAFRYFPSANGLVINEKRPPEDEAITMVDQFAALLQPHQVEGIRFLWENTMKSITDARQPDSKETYGCVLAHCMGLGKTFTVIAFLATLMANPTIRGIVDPDPSLHAEDAGFSPERPKPLIHRVLVITPKNVLHNWAKEVYKWTPKELLPLLNITTVDGTNQSKADKHRKRLQQIHDWYVKGGILVMSYEMFRSLVIEDTRDTNISATDKQLRLEKAQKYLVDPGPDMVVADEAHIIKNDRTKINEAVSALRTKRRIALTGTPLQNHLDEYWCMVEWVKKRFLYSRKEFMKLFIRPIREGEAKDAPLSRVQNMKKRSHALHKRLTPIVHRKDQSELSKMISKREFIITVRMTGFQSYLYKLYLSKLKRSGTTFLFRCFQTMMRISNHPVNIALHAATWIQNDMNKAIRAHSGSSKLSLREAARQLTPIHDHYKNQGKEALQKLERAADRNEQGLLRESTKTSSKASRRGAKNAKKRKAKGKARRRLKKLEEQIARVDEDDILFDDDDDDDDDYFDEDDDGNSTHGDSSDDGYGEDNLDDDDGADLEDFVVDDDVIEYNSDDSASDLLESKLRKRKAKKTHKNKSKRIRLDDLSSESTAVLLDDSDDDDDDNGDEDDSSVEIVADPKKSQSNPTKEALDTETKNSFPPNDTKQEAKALSAESAMEEDYFGEDGYFKPEPMWAPRSTVNEVIPPPKEESPAPDSTPVPSSVEAVPSPTPKKLETASTNEVVPAASSTEPTITIVDDGALENDLTEDEEPDELGSNWWKEIGADVTESTEPLSARDLLRLSNKMIIVLSLLARTVLEGEKMIIFSQSLYTLDVIEKFLSLRKWGELVGNNFENDAHRFSMWSKGEEYLRIDGSISNRQSLIDKFNDPVKGARTHLMLISTKAGNMGINLQAANRLVLFDCSWNPMHDLQAIYRAYRVGQHRDVFIYRLVSSGTMEEKIYKKQVSKMARANRVVDAQMPSNAFTEKEKSELLEFDEEESPDLDDNDDMVDGNAPAPTKRSNALQQLMDALQEGTQDKVLMQFLEEYGTSLFKSIENHDSFLVDDSEQHLNSEEKESAELELQRELDSLRGVVRPSTSSFVAATAAPSQLPPPPPPPPAVVKPTTVAPTVTRVTKAVVNTRPAAPAQPLIGAPRPNTPNREFTDQQMQILVATVSLLPADTYFERVSMSMNVLFGYRNGVNAISADEYRKLFQRMNQQGKVSEYVTNPNFQNFREQVRLAYLRRGITL